MSKCSFRVVRWLGALLVAAMLPNLAAAETRPAAKPGNSLCYVCHLSLQNDEITVKHLEEDIGCADCHGVSDEHMHDEMLMTKPDLLHGRKEVVKMCSQCHEDPHEDKKNEHKAFLEKWRGRDRPNGRSVTESSICTDCHGTHVLARKPVSSDAGRAGWTELFNGRDQAGWTADPPDGWRVQRGRLVASPRTMAELWSDAAYSDFRLSLTFRAEGPIRAGIRFRGQPAAPGPRVEILTDAQAPARAGSVLVPGKGWALANLRDDLLDAEGWNTVIVECRGPRVAVSLNGEEIGAVAVAGASEGRLGLHVESVSGAADSTLAVRDIPIQSLSAEAETVRP